MPRIMGATLALMLGGSPAFAHVDITSSVPANGGELAPGSKQVTLTFDALIKQAACGLTDSSGVPAAGLGAPQVEREKVTLLLAGALTAGTYTLACKVAGPDGHDRAHSISFTVKAAP